MWLAFNPCVIISSPPRSPLFPHYSNACIKCIQWAPNTVKLYQWLCQCKRAGVTINFSLDPVMQIDFIEWIPSSCPEKNESHLKISVQNSKVTITVGNAAILHIQHIELKKKRMSAMGLKIRRLRFLWEQHSVHSRRGPVTGLLIFSSLTAENFLKPHTAKMKKAKK